MRGVGYVVALTAVYCLALGRAYLADVLTGAVAAAALVHAYRAHVLSTPDPWRRPQGIVRGLRHAAARLRAAPWFVLVVLADITRSTWSMAGLVLGLRRVKGPGMVEVPIGDRSLSGVVVTAVVSTLAPGSVLVEIVVPADTSAGATSSGGRESGFMLFHIASLESASQVRNEYEHRYQEAQRKVFP